MISLAWQLDKHVARLQSDRFGAAVDLTRPAEGIVDVGVDGRHLEDARLLAAEIPSLRAGDADSLIEHYARGAELVAAYRQSAEHPVRVDSLWRALPHTASDLIAAVELVVSVRTELLNSRPEMHVQSGLAANEVLRLTNTDAAGYVPIVPSTTETILQPSDGIGCVLFRPTGAEISYAEMIHPDDFQHDEVLCGGRKGRCVLLRHRLFSERLEKGVILRARLRAAFVPRNDDLRIAAACYGSFVATEAPLESY
ncbi:MAG: hypothetical protein JXB62_03650 [Pirellulales bacterium]|nr:hypothetical protein [Pirellulales bacterium]